MRNSGWIIRAIRDYSSQEKDEKAEFLLSLIIS